MRVEWRLGFGPAGCSAGGCGEVGACAAPAGELGSDCSVAGGRPTRGDPLRDTFAHMNVLGGVELPGVEERGGVVGGEGEGGFADAPAALSTISCEGISVMLCDFAVMPIFEGMGMGCVEGAEGVEVVGGGWAEEVAGVGRVLLDGTRLNEASFACVCCTSVLMPSAVKER